MMDDLGPIPIDNGDIILVPGENGTHCPGNPEQCDECDYLMICTNCSGWCSKCLEENGKCQLDV